MANARNDNPNGNRRGHNLFNRDIDSAFIAISGYILVSENFKSSQNLFIKTEPKNFSQAFLKGLGSVRHICSITAGIGATILYHSLLSKPKVTNCSYCGRIAPKNDVQIGE